MSNRVRYYITETDERAVVRSVPVTVTSQPANELMTIERRGDSAENSQPTRRKPVGRIVKVLRKQHTSARA